MSLPMHLVESLVDARVGGRVEVTGDEAHHAVAVRRMRVGQQLLLTDGAGTVLTARVSETATRLLVVEVIEVRRESRPEPSLCVVQALPKGDRGELAVEVLTEVGVAVIVPWAAHRSVTAWRGERATKGRARWRSSAREAAKQSRRSWHPEVTGLAGLDEVADRVRGAALAVVLHEAATVALSSVAVPTSGEIVLVVGPEGGLDESEVAVLTAAGAVAVRLGAEVLRTSTAGVVGAAAVLSRTPRWT